MILKQFHLECLSQVSYLVGDSATGRAVVVDPRRDVDEYLAEARANNLVIEGVINTHFHADFVSGHLELVKATGAWVGFGESARTDFPIRRFAHGDHISLGNVDIEILSTPGHTWESISLLIRQVPDAEPAAVLTGDSLFIGDVGRPDLANLGGSANTDLARAMYKTIHDTLLTLPDEVLVMPAHGAGSSCGKNLSTALVCTIGEQRRANPAVQPMSEEAFVELITTGQPAVPGYFHTDANLNRRVRTVLDDSRPLPALTADAIRGCLADESVVVFDTRTPEEFAASHLAGSVNVGLAGRFAETCGMVATLEDRIVLIGHPGTEHEAALRLSRIGYDAVVGYLSTAGSSTGGGFPEQLSDLVRSGDRVSASQLARLLSDGEVTVLDVRNIGERDAGKIAGSSHIPLAELRTRYDEVPANKPVVVHCRSGWRSSVAASVLRARGRTGISDLVGGYLAWEQAGAQPA